MNSFWSRSIQSADSLFSSRALRFSPRTRDDFVPFFRLPEGIPILELGCGPGALASALSGWYPSSKVTAVDRDCGFISYAREHVPGVTFLEADILSLPFENGSFGACVSNTVSEHVDPVPFYSEQLRVLESGGICIVLSSRKTISVSAPCIASETPFEEDVWRRTARLHSDMMHSGGVGAYWQSEAELPLAMERCGFKDVSTAFTAVDLTPDSPDVSTQEARSMIESLRLGELGNIDALPYFARDAVSDGELSELRRLANARYDERLRLLESGLRQWDCEINVIMAVRGVKP